MKTIIVGDSGIGKTCILSRFCDNVYINENVATVGIDWRVKILQPLDTGKIVKIQLWDTAGQDRFRSITQAYYRTANAVIFAFDLTKINSFLNLNTWLTDLEKNQRTDKETLKILIGTKADLESKVDSKLIETFLSDSQSPIFPSFRQEK